MEQEDSKRLDRRAFLETGVTGSIGLVLGLTASSALQKDEAPPEMVRMLTADGNLVEVERNLLPVMCGKPVAVSNRELKDWMEQNRK